MKTPYDYIVIGSGLGGPPATLQLAEKGFAVGAMEKGRCRS